jgi:hypothetical protein
VVITPVGVNAPVTLVLLPPPPDPLVPLPPPPAVPPVVVEAGDAGELPPQATISRAVKSRSSIENARMVYLLNPLHSSDLRVSS